MTQTNHPPITVYYTYPLEPAVLADLRQQLDDNIRLINGPEPPMPPETQILVTGRPTAEQLAGPALQALVIPWAGLPTETRELLPDFPHLSLHNLHHNAIPVAEMTISLLLAAAKFIVPMDRDLRRHDWSPRYRPSPAMLLAGKTALILGYGAIGRRAARLCRAMGMRVLATRRRPTVDSDEWADEIHPAEALPDLLPRAEGLLICLPHTPETDDLIGPGELKLLPRPAVLVNIGRGPIVNQEALYNALKSGRLHGAGLDVWYNYPPDKEARGHTPPADFPFHELDNVVMSPHRGGTTLDTEKLRMQHLARLLNAAARAEPLPNRVDPRSGY